MITFLLTTLSLFYNIKNDQKSTIELIEIG